MQRSQGRKIELETATSEARKIGGDMLNKLNKALSNYAALNIGDAIEEIDRHLHRRIDIAVTGLRRSGKTVFITSLIRNLLASVRNPQALDGFVPAGGPLVGIEEIPPGSALQKSASHDSVGCPRRRFADVAPLL